MPIEAPTLRNGSRGLEMVVRLITPPPNSPDN
jgi:hypothetical protein